MNATSRILCNEIKKRRHPSIDRSIHLSIHPFIHRLGVVTTQQETGRQDCYVLPHVHGFHGPRSLCGPLKPLFEAFELLPRVSSGLTTTANRPPNGAFVERY